MNVFSRLINASLEVLSNAAYTAGIKGRMFWDSDSNRPCIDDGTNARSFLMDGDITFPADGKLEFNNPKSGTVGSLQTIECLMEHDNDECDIKFLDPLPCFDIPFQVGTVGHEWKLPDDGVNSYWSVVPAGNDDSINFGLEFSNAGAYSLAEGSRNALSTFPDTVSQTASPNTGGMANGAMTRFVINKPGRYLVHFDLGVKVVRSASFRRIHPYTQFHYTVSSSITDTRSQNFCSEGNFPVDKFFLDYIEEENIDDRPYRAKVSQTAVLRLQAGDWFEIYYSYVEAQVDGGEQPLNWGPNCTNVGFWRLSR